MACIPIDILAHADFSARHKASRHQPGFGAFGSFVRTLQRQNPKGTLLLSAGDEISSPYWGGEPEPWLWATMSLITAKPFWKTP